MLPPPARSPRRPPRSLLLLAPRIVLEPVGVDVLGLLLVLFQHQPLSAVVQVVRFEAVLRRGVRDVTVLAVLRRHALLPGVHQELGCSRRRARAENAQQGRGSSNECSDAVHIRPLLSLRNEIRESLRDGGHFIQPPEPDSAAIRRPIGHCAREEPANGACPGKPGNSSARLAWTKWFCSCTTMMR